MNDLREVKHLGPYRLIRLMSRGGMGEVHLAREQLHPGIERDVVVKQLSSANAQDPERRAMLFDEARILNQLQHPSIPHLYGVGESEGIPYLALELIRGASLRDLADGAASSSQLPQRLPLGVALFVCLRVAETLAYVHEADDVDGRPLRIVHRDLKPSNVMVSLNGTVALIDFGIASAENRVHETHTGMLKGTTGYMAPEQLLGRPIDRRTDLYALGVMLYELSAGRHPFAERSPRKMLQRITEGEYEPLDEKLGDARRAVAWLVRRCMSVAPEDRPSHAGQVAAEIREELRVHADAPSPREVGALVGEHLGTLVASDPRSDTEPRVGARWQTDVDSS